MQLMESVSNCACDCAVYNPKVAQLPFPSIQVRRIAKMAAMGQKAKEWFHRKDLGYGHKPICVLKIFNLGLEFSRRASKFRPLYTKNYPIH